MARKERRNDTASETPKERFSFLSHLFNNWFQIHITTKNEEVKHEIDRLLNAISNAGSPLYTNVENLIHTEFVEVVLKEIEALSKQGSEKIELNLDQVITEHSDEIKKNVQKIYDASKNTANAVERLNESCADIYANIIGLSKTCEQTLYYSRLTHELCVKLFGEVVGIKELLVKEIFGEDGVFQRTINLAEKRYEQLASAASKAATKEASAIPAGLDQRDIVAMFNWIKEIYDKGVGTSEITELINAHKQDLQEQLRNIDAKLDSIKNDISATRNNSVKILEQEARALNMLKEIGEETVAHRKQIEALTTEVSELKDQIKELESKLNGKTDPVERKQIEKELRASEDELLRKQRELEQAEIDKKLLQDKYLSCVGDPKELIESSCPFCGYRALRKVIGGKCSCEACGHPFTGLDPNVKDISDDKLLEGLQSQDKTDGEQWRTRHMARLEKVGEGFYRMKIEPYTVSSKGVLIIPPFDTASDTPEGDKKNWHKGDRISQIDFCEPNTNDAESWKVLKERTVKTLLLPEGVEIGKYNEVIPFSEMKDSLIRVLRYGSNEEAEDDMSTLNLIHGLQAKNSVEPQNGVEDA